MKGKKVNDEMGKEFDYIIKAVKIAVATKMQILELFNEYAKENKVLEMSLILVEVSNALQKLSAIIGSPYLPLLSIRDKSVMDICSKIDERVASIRKLASGSMTKEALDGTEIISKN